MWVKSSCNQNDAETDLDDDSGGAIHCIVCNGATSPLFHHVSRINAGLSASPISPTYPPPPPPLHRSITAQCGSCRSPSDPIVPLLCINIHHRHYLQSSSSSSSSPKTPSLSRTSSLSSYSNFPGRGELVAEANYLAKVSKVPTAAIIIILSSPLLTHVDDEKLEHDEERRWQDEQR